MAKLSSQPFYRFLEIIPGSLVWITFLSALIFSIYRPLWVIYFVIIFDLYWFYRFSYLLIHLLSSYYHFQKALRVDWLEKCQALPDWQRIYHLIFLPTCREPYEVIENTFTSLLKSNFPQKQILVVLAGEERDKENFLILAEKIREHYEDKFFKLLFTLHPDNVMGEVKGKGANINYAGWQAKKVIDELKLPYDKIVVSSFDIDTCVHPKYFSYLTYQYLIHPDPLHTSFQPIPLYHNNIWQSPAINRVVANSTTFWQMTEHMRPERMFTFSSHSMSFKALVDVGFWENDIVTEDSRIFIQCFLKYGGNYTVTPMYIPLSMDTVFTGNFWQTLVAQYKQMRRWGWGIEHFPYMIWHFKKRQDISWSKKVKHLFNLTEGMYSWATAPILILVLGRLPLWLADYSEKKTLLAQNAPYVLEIMMNLALIGILVAAVISTIILPRRPKDSSRWKILVMILQWILFPLTMVVFGSLPAIEAQTRLMLGKYLGFWVTPKSRQ